MAGVLSMVGIAFVVDWFRTPDWVELTMSERVWRAIEKSGTLGIFTDLNGMLEQATGGQVGARAVMGQRMIVREPSPADAIGAILGPGPNLWANLTYAMFSDDATADQQSRSIRYMVPYNNVLWWGGMFSEFQRSLSNTLEE